MRRYVRSASALLAVAAVVAVGFASTGTPAAANGTAGIYTGIDNYPTKQLPNGCNYTEQPGVTYFRQMIMQLGGTNLGTAVCNAGDTTSYHQDGRAFDWGANASNPADVARVDTVLKWLLATDERGNPLANARRLGIGEVIWNYQIIALWEGSTKAWRPRACDGTASDCHTNHVHFSFSWAGALKQTSFHTSRSRVPQFALANSLNSSVATLPVFGYGFGSSQVISGDWDGVGGDGIGIYDQTTARFYLRNGLNGGIADREIWFGNFGDKPIAGDWDGDGRDDIGVYRPTESRFYFLMLDGDPPPNPVWLGDVGFLPLVGDWNGDGRDEVGVYNPATATFYRGPNAPGQVFGNGGDVPLVGDFTVDRISELAVYRPSNRTFYFLTFSEDGPTVVRSITYGDANGVPVVGDWDGNGSDTQGIVFG